MIDVDVIEEDFSEYKKINYVPSNNSIKTRRMVIDESGKAEHDKKFTTYIRKSRKTKFGQKGKMVEEYDILKQPQYD